MDEHILVVVGTSAGGLHELLVSQLPRSFPAAMLVVQHTAPGFTSRLADILDEAGSMPATIARHGDRIMPGHIYIAPADHHLLVTDSRIELSRGPRENFSRPAIDPLFRSAAQAHGPDVIAVLLSGMLGDGTVGLMAVKAHGGTTIVQDPLEAPFSEMPANAIEHAPVDHVLSIDDIAALLAQRTGKSSTSEGLAPMTTSIDNSSDIVRRDLKAQAEDRRSGQTATFGCPECGGTLWQIPMEGVEQYRCHVGHAYAPDVLMEGMSYKLENALWSAVRGLVERAVFARQTAARHRAAGRQEQAQALLEQADQDEAHMHLIRAQVLGLSASEERRAVGTGDTGRREKAKT